jgi:Flp pilus assembly protein TadD
VAQEAVAFFETTDVVNIRAEAFAELGRALEQAGRRNEAAQALERALELYEQKGNVVSAQAVRRKLDGLEHATGAP